MMKATEKGKLTKEKSIEIANKLLEIFAIFCSNVPMYQLSFPIIEEEESDLDTYILYEWNENMGSEVRKRREKICCQEDMFRNNTYKITFKEEEYEINIFDSPSACGYNSILPNYDEETYLLAHVKELNKQGTIKYEIFFGFNILDMSFLELFDIHYINKKGYRRECKEIEIEELQNNFEGRKLRT